MLAVIDHRSSDEAINKLYEFVNDIYLFSSEGITYSSISGHPDIFIYQDINNLIAAPNSPRALFDFLNKHKIKYSIGEKNIGEELNESVPYNCLSTDKYLFHKQGFTDRRILELCSMKKFINLPQAYTRCGLLNLDGDKYITSDRGIEKELKRNNLECFYFDPSEIAIHGHKNGFIGGTSGINGGKIFFNGNIGLHRNGNALRRYINESGLEIINLCDNKLYDGGHIFFIEN